MNMVKKAYTTKLVIPEGINVEVTDNLVKIKGVKGELSRNFNSPRTEIKREENVLAFGCKKNVKFSRMDKMVINTYRAHIKNMFFGVTKGYAAKLKICSGHFPMNVSLDGNTLVIKNFLGEKVPRKASIDAGVKVQVQGEIVSLNGLDKERVGQTAARFEQATRITNRDRRIFQDGLFITSKPGDEDE